MGAALGEVPSSALDLGSGGGLPGLPLALAWPSSRWVLLDGRVVRAEFLERAVERLGLADRVTVVGDRAEVAGRGEWRGSFAAAFARSFGGPAVTAECAAPFLRVGGHLVVAEPPGGEPARWPVEGLDLLGLEPGRTVTGPTAVQLLVQVRPCPDRYPRRVGIPAKRPLF
jgi:16S rRNA (guanine527-N7)-methyltransferase